MRGSPFEGLGHRAIATMDVIEVAALHPIDRGFEETTAENIATASGVSVRTFFRYSLEVEEGVMVLQFRCWVQLLGEATRRRPPQESAWTAMREAVRSIPAFSGPVGVSAEAVWMRTGRWSATPRACTKG